MSMQPHDLPALRGGLIALGAALLFGASTLLVQKFGSGVGSFWTAALLYAGAALAGGCVVAPGGTRGTTARVRLAAPVGDDRLRRSTWARVAGLRLGEYSS
ncbi:MAG: hypothetical protein JNM79_04460 [Burkholderiales bacterium]|nr:hypothetical protein [Burkholderiales bacterium]